MVSLYFDVISLNVKIVDNENCNPKFFEKQWSSISWKSEQWKIVNADLSL